MIAQADTIGVYLEIGQKRTFAGAIDWPGWCRSGRHEEDALQALLHSGPRYSRVLQAAQIEFRVPQHVSAFAVVERLAGTTTTDFGAPDTIPSHDRLPLDAAELQRLQQVLKACWHAFDAAAQTAVGRELRKGPRGGGRDLDGIARHVLAAEQGYLARLGTRFKPTEAAELSDQFDLTRQAVLNALAVAAQGGTPLRGPRGGVIWPPRYFVRRSAWHVLDHVWEVEDRGA